MTPGTHCHPMIFSSGQAGGQLQLICKPCPQTTPVRPGNYHWEISSPCQIIVKFVFWNLRTVGCGMWYQIYWQDRQWRSIIIFQIQHISSDSCYSIKHKELASAFDYWGGTEARTTQSHQKTFRLQIWHDMRENGGSQQFTFRPSLAGMVRFRHISYYCQLLSNRRLMTRDSFVVCYRFVELILDKSFIDISGL